MPERIHRHILLVKRFTERIPIVNYDFQAEANHIFFGLSKDSLPFSSLFRVHELSSYFNTLRWPHSFRRFSRSLRPIDAVTVKIIIDTYHFEGAKCQIETCYIHKGEAEFTPPLLRVGRPFKYKQDSN